MNIWTEKSIELATQSDYLDRLYHIYPIFDNPERKISEEILRDIKGLLDNSDSYKLIELLLDKNKIPTFPVKDSYVAFLREDRNAMSRNPKTVARLFNRIKSLGLAKLNEEIMKPIESNRQNGSSFKKWLEKGNLGVTVTKNEDDFFNVKNERIIFIGSDEKIADIASQHLGYIGEKGLDFLAKFNNKFILGEAKFLSSNGGNQNNQITVAETVLYKVEPDKDKVVLPILILDGVLYLDKNNKLCRFVRERKEDEVILSSVLLREYLFSV